MLHFNMKHLYKSIPYVITQNLNLTFVGFSLYVIPKLTDQNKMKADQTFFWKYEFRGDCY